MNLAVSKMRSDAVFTKSEGLSQIKLLMAISIEVIIFYLGRNEDL